MKKFLHNNGLSLVLFGLFFFTFLVGQSIAGSLEYNQENLEHGQPAITYVEYLGTSHFLEATMENWESEFLQMFFFVVLTVFLYQKGSAESKKPGEKEEVDRDPRKSRNKNAPWPVRKGGLALRLYEHSLSMAFFLLFAFSFLFHAVGGAGVYNDELKQHGKAQHFSVVEYVGTSRFWFESLQNWQSEFLAVGSMVVLTIFLREKGSKESKPVDAPHAQTGDG